MKLPTSIFILLFRPNFSQFNEINAIFFGITLCFGLLIGSGVSVFVCGAIIYGFWHLVSGRLSWSLPSPVKAMSLALTAVFAADLFAALINPSSIAFSEALENSPLLGLPALYAVLIADRQKLLIFIERVASVVALLLAGAIQLGIFSNLRAEFFAGNANVAALLSGLLFVFTLIGAIRKLEFGLSAIGAVASAYLIVVTGTRALWPLLVIAPGIAVFLLVPGSYRKKTSYFSILLAGLGLVAVFVMPSISDRINRAQIEIEQAQVGELDSSIGMRVAMYKTGLGLFLSKPIVGYGPGNERAFMRQKIKDDYQITTSFSHAHNAFLNQALRSGILGVLALCAVLLTPIYYGYRAVNDEIGNTGFAILSSVLATYFLSGVSGLFFGHDIHDTVFVSSICFALYLICDRAIPPNT